MPRHRLARSAVFARAISPRLRRKLPRRGGLTVFAGHEPLLLRLSGERACFGDLGPRLRHPWTIDHDYVAPRFVLVLPCSCPPLGLGGTLLFSLAIFR